MSNSFLDNKRNILIIGIIIAFLMLLIFLFNYIHFAKSSATGFMVVSENAIASEIGAGILREGGNAIDAAVAVGYALAVVNPCCGNIGGGGFMTIHFANGKNTFINFREKTPLKANKNLFIDKEGKKTFQAIHNPYLSVAVPGTVMGLDYALQKYGTMQRVHVMSPAIKLAENGFIITPYEAKQFNQYKNYFQKQLQTAIFLNLHAGNKLQQKDLAKTLKEIAALGSSVFYQGHIANEVVAASKKNGGILTLNDFSQYSVQEMQAITCQYRNYDVISSSPPSSGGVILCEMLNVLENFSLAKFDFHHTKSIYYLIETMRYGFIDRNTKIGDPDFVKNPIDQLLSTEYARQISEKISDSKYIPNTDTRNAYEEVNTTHYSIVDQQGNAVAVTYTLNSTFGAKIIAGDTGFFLNDAMNNVVVQLRAAKKLGVVNDATNEIAPGKRPLSSMTPTIIMHGGKVFMVLGSPGGTRIITSVLQTILNVIDYGMTIEKAIAVPRLHYQVHPNVVYTEPNAFSADTSKELQGMGYKIRKNQPWSAVEAILIDKKSGVIHGASDRRRPDGAAIGE